VLNATRDFYPWIRRKEMCIRDASCYEEMRTHDTTGSIRRVNTRHPEIKQQFSFKEKQKGRRKITVHHAISTEFIKRL